MGVLDEHARVPRFGGLGSQVALLAPLRRGFLLPSGLPRECSAEIRVDHLFRQRAELDHREDPCPFNFSSNTSRGSGTIVSRSDMDGRFSSER
jgi:hypothetical protein